MRSSFQPFLISEFKTGLFSYLEPWIRPIDAFNPLTNAYVYRGTLNKRNGYDLFGRMAYCDNNIDLGDGGVSYSGTLSVHPIAAGSFAPTDGTETFTDNGDGTLTGSAGGTGTINYTTGAWTLTFNAVVAANTNIYAHYYPNVSRPIMGLKQWDSESTGEHKLVAFDTRRAAIYNASTEVFDPICSVSQVLWVSTGGAIPASFSTGWAAVSPYTQVFAPFSVSVTATVGANTETTTDDGAGNLPATTNVFDASTVDYATGVIALVLKGISTGNVTMTADLVGDYFTGTSANFFNTANWLAPAYAASNPGTMYIANNADPITTFDGTDLARPPFPITQANYTTFTNDINYCLDLDVYKNRLLLQRPFVRGDATVSGQSVRWSAINSPTNLIADVTGNGGELSAPTNDFIQSSEFLRDQLILLFNNSTWNFRFTGNDFSPFRIDKINTTKSTNAPYATVPYDERITAVGSKGLIATDGVNVQRYDNEVIDEFLKINQAKFAQCYATRFDTINQTWTLYPDAETNAQLSTQILVYNFIENTWGTYDLALSCLGLFYVTADATWNDFGPSSANPTTWEQAEFSWDSYLSQELAPTLLGGALSGGYVYQMNYGESDYNPDDPDGDPIEASITSTRWNPFVGQGAKVQFGYIDIYYDINNECTLELSFFVDNSEATAATRTITLTGPTNSDVSWQRVYINVVGEFLRMNIYNNQAQTFKILGMILWASPSGRLTPGLTVT